MTACAACQLWQGNDAMQGGLRFAVFRNLSQLFNNCFWLIELRTPLPPHTCVAGDMSVLPSLLPSPTVLHGVGLGVRGDLLVRRADGEVACVGVAVFRVLGGADLGSGEW
mmetsp:Transcript_67804/g.113869  ORF Transcript_67804/g.113869 Transcript_67804/m.113869 type:complete len:110 (-) Transcript_67804:396-725(-)